MLAKRLNWTLKFIFRKDNESPYKAREMDLAASVSNTLLDELVPVHGVLLQLVPKGYSLEAGCTPPPPTHLPTPHKKKKKKKKTEKKKKERRESN